MPVVLAGRADDGVAGADAQHVPVSGADQADTLGDVQGLADGVGVPVGTGTWGEPHQRDGHPRRAGAVVDRRQVDVAGECRGRRLDRGTDGIEFHEDPRAAWLDQRPERSVIGSGGPLRLTPTEWQLLEHLLRHPGKLISQTALLDGVWGPQFRDQANYLRQYMARLRRKLELDPAHPRHLLTEPGMGYRYLP